MSDKPEAAPLPDGYDAFGRWMRRPLKNTTVIEGIVPGPAKPQGHVDVPPAPVVDLTALLDRKTGIPSGRGLKPDGGLID
jgi:hypothetical protein